MEGIIVINVFMITRPLDEYGNVYLGTKIEEEDLFVYFTNLQMNTNLEIEDRERSTELVRVSITSIIITFLKTTYSLIITH